MVDFYTPKADNPSKPILPTKALVLYGAGENSNVVAVTEHDIRSDLTLSIGRTVSPTQLINKVSMLKSSKKRSNSNLLPSNLLMDSSENMVWFKKRAIQNMWFRMDKVESLYVEWPPLLFRVDKVKRQLFVFALGKNTRPTLGSRIYHAPLMNISVNGALCLGTSTLPREFDFANLDQCESALIHSQFTHTNHEKTFRHKTSSQEHFEYWRSKACKNKPKRILAKELAPSITLKELLMGLK